jgi:hypothetical protein
MPIFREGCVRQSASDWVKADMLSKGFVCLCVWCLFRRYVNNGDFQLPLLKGAVPQWIIGSEDGYRALQEELKKGKGASKVELSDGAWAHPPPLPCLRPTTHTRRVHGRLVCCAVM